MPKAPEEPDLQRYRDLAEQALDLILELDEDAGICYASPSHEPLLGYDADTMIGRSALGFLHPDDVAETAGVLSRAIAEERADRVLCRVRHAAGHWVWVQFTGRPFRNREGERRVAVVGRDISDRLAAEHALRESEQRFRVLFETARCGIIESDARGRISLANEALARMLGRPVAQIMGLHLWELYHDPVERRRVKRELDRPGAAEPEPQRGLQLLSGPSGRPISVEMDWDYRRDANDRVVGFVTIITDVSEREATDRALAETQRYATRIAETSPAMMCVFDVKTGRVRYANSRNTQNLGWTPSELQGIGDRAFEELVHPEDRAIVAQGMADVIQSNDDEAAADVEYRVRRKDGEWRWVLGRFAPFTRNAEGVPLEVLTAQIDVTEQRRAVEKLRTQEERFRLLAENAVDVIIEFDAQGRILFVSPSWTAQTGYPVEPILEGGIAWLVNNVMIPEESRWHGEGRLPVFEDGGEATRIYRLRHANDAWRWFETRTRVFETGDGEPRGITIARDVTDRYQAEEALRASEARFRLVAESVYDYTLELTPDGEVAYLSPSFRDIMGFEPEGFRTRDAVRLLHPSDRRRVVEAMRQLLDGEPIGPLAYRHRDGAGTWRWLETYGAPRPTPEGRHAAVAITRDISEKVAAEEETRRLQEQLLQSQKLDSLGVLAGGIAHDFNNLLVGILGNASMALADISPESPLRETLEGIEVAALRAGELTNQMLAYAGKGRFVIEPLDLNALVEEMAHLLEASITKKAVLRFDLGPSLPAVDGDGTQLRQLVMNLITNASDALGSEAGALEVRTRTLDEPQLWELGSSPESEIPDGPVVMLEISDTGCGMDPSTLSRIFDPFFTTKFTGRGLGLAAALGIVRGHRGRIDVRSEPGDGTCFQVLLPASERKLLPAASPAAPSVRPPAVRGTILVADDEEVVRSMARRILEQAGFDVLTAADGRDAVEYFREHAADVSAVLLDLTMPRLGGEEALRVLRQIRPGVRVVITSGYSESDIATRFEGQDLDGFLQKPFRPADLVECIALALEEPPTS